MKREPEVPLISHSGIVGLIAALSIGAQPIVRHFRAASSEDRDGLAFADHSLPLLEALLLGQL